MTVDEWLAALDPAPPPELAAAMRASLDGASGQDLLDAARRVLSRVLSSECARREAALDLLTVDALITHALDMSLDTGASAKTARLAIERLNQVARESLPS